MPTVKPRIAVTLTERTYNVISRLAALEDRSKASVAAEYLEMATSSLETILNIAERAAKAPEEHKEKLLQSLGRIEKTMLGNLQDLEQLDLYEKH